MTPEDVLRVIGRDARRLMSRAGWPPNTCLSATRVVIDLCRSHGLKARAISTAVSVQDASDMVVAQLGRTSGGRLTESGWAGHLVAVIEGYLVDVTLHQITLAGHEKLPTIVAKVEGELSGDLSVELESHTVTYRPLLSDESYREAADWCEESEPLRWLRIELTDLTRLSQEDRRPLSCLSHAG